MNNDKSKGFDEPWKLRKSNHKDSNIWYIDDKTGFGGQLANTWSDVDGVQARRIVACVNACSGIDTDLLENEKYHGEVLGSAHALICAMSELIDDLPPLDNDSMVVKHYRLKLENYRSLMSGL